MDRCCAAEWKPAIPAHAEVFCFPGPRRKNLIEQRSPKDSGGIWYWLAARSQGMERPAVGRQANGIAYQSSERSAFRSSARFLRHASKGKMVERSQDKNT